MRMTAVLHALSTVFLVSLAQATSVDRSSLMRADITSDEATDSMPPSLRVLTVACGRHADPEAPFAAAELADLGAFGRKNEALVPTVCRVFHGRRAT